MRQIIRIDVSNYQNNSEIDPLTRERLRCLLAQEREKPAFKENPKLQKNHIYTIKRIDEQGQLIEEGLLLSQSLILRTSKKGDDRLQVGDPTMLGEGAFGKVKLATRYLRFLPNKQMDVKDVSQVAKVITLTRNSSETVEEWNKRIIETENQFEAEQQFTQTKYPKTKAVLMRRFSKGDKNNSKTETVKFYLYMPNLGESLLAILKEAPDRYQDDAALKLMRDISADLAHVHALGIVHGDLKTDNILVDAQQHPSIGDFGWSRQRARPVQHVRMSIFPHSEERQESVVGVQYDISSLAEIGGYVFGGIALLNDKGQPGRTTPTVRLFFPYVFANLKNLSHPNTRLCVMNFIEWMSDLDPKHRPSAKVCQYFFEYMCEGPNLRTLFIDLLTGQLDEARRQQHATELNALKDILTEPKFEDQHQALRHTLSLEMLDLYLHALQNPEHPLQKFLQTSLSQAIDHAGIRSPDTLQATSQGPAQSEQSQQASDWNNVITSETLLVSALKGINDYLQKLSAHLTMLQRLFGHADQNKIRAQMYRDLLQNQTHTRVEKLTFLLALLETRPTSELAGNVMLALAPKSSRYPSEEVKAEVKAEAQAKDMIIRELRAVIFGTRPTLEQYSQLTVMTNELIDTIEEGKNPLTDERLNFRERLQQLVARPVAIASLRGANEGSMGPQ